MMKWNMSIENNFIDLYVYFIGIKILLFYDAKQVYKLWLYANNGADRKFNNDA